MFNIYEHGTSANILSYVKIALGVSADSVRKFGSELASWLMIIKLGLSNLFN